MTWSGGSGGVRLRSGADDAAGTAYARTKARGEAAVLRTIPDAVIMRPSIVFGPEDGFFNKFATMARYAPVLPLIGGGHTKFQPVYVADVAEAVARSVDGTIERGRVNELGGPEVLTFRQCLELMLRVVDRKTPLVSLPFGVASLIGSIASLIPFVKPALTADQVKLLQSDNVVSEAARAEGRTLDQAIREAGEMRFLPIVLTSLTAIGGLFPIAISTSPLISPLAIVLIGGLISSTLLSRLVTPVVYMLIPPKV